MPNELSNDIQRLGRLVLLCESIMSEVAEITDEKEYSRIRAYLESRFDIELPYSSPFIEKPEK